MSAGQIHIEYCGMPMRYLIARALSFAVALFLGVSTTAEENPCSGIDTQSDCEQLGTLKDSVMLVGKLNSCSASRYSSNVDSIEDSDSSVIRQFDLTKDGFVTLEVEGIGEALILNEDQLVFRAEGNMSSVQHRFEPGRYTLIARAPLCQNGAEGWNGRYKIMIGPSKTEQTDSIEPDASVNLIAVPTPEPETPLLQQVAMWSIIALMVPLSLLALVILDAIY